MKRYIRHLKNWAKGYLIAARGIYNLAVHGRIRWLISVTETRLQYKLSALHNGISMNREGQANSFNLRRNTHRLEKGLSHNNLRESFAESYIMETIGYLAEAKQLKPQDNNLLPWSTAVLDEYFRVTQHTPIISDAYKRYLSLNTANQCPDWFPYLEASRPDLTVTYDDFFQLGLRRRSVRSYLDKPVEFEIVEKAMAVAALAPSACNRQPFHFLFYNNADIVQKLVRVPGGATGFTPPGMVVVIGRYRAFFDERDATVPVIDSSLSVMSFLFACETLGLSTVCINWPNLPDRDRKIRNLIYLEDDEFIIMMIGLGYADPTGKIPFSAKHDVKELISCNARIKTT